MGQRAFKGFPGRGRGEGFWASNPPRIGVDIVDLNRLRGEEAPPRSRPSSVRGVAVP